jgi:mannose-6-phosphate isomerase
VRRLDNPVRAYAWGSRTTLAALQGRAPSAEPEAELWMGAHPSAPSQVAPDESLLDLVNQDPQGTLGPAVQERFGRLPYLLKLLAAAQPLSIQVHPDADQAAAGFAAEEAAGVRASERNYVDSSHKPELLVAVEPFEALCGFRDPRASASLLESLGVTAFAPAIAALHRGDLRAGLELLLTSPPELVAELVATGQPLAARLGAQYPTDPGVAVALLLNQVTLQPDEAVFMPAGNLHAYLSGFGVEVMAASDNVLRGGLTPKRVDVPELLRLVRYEVLEDPVVRPVRLAPGLLTWPAPVAEFALVKAVGPAVLPGHGPRIVCCLRGPAGLSTGGAWQSLGGGEAVFVGASEPAVRVDGSDAVVVQAAPAIA